MKAFKRLMHAPWYPNYPHDSNTKPIPGKKTLSFLERFLVHETVFVTGMIPFTAYVGETIRCKQSAERPEEAAEIPREME